MARILVAEPDHREPSDASSSAFSTDAASDAGDALSSWPSASDSPSLTRRLRHHLWQKSGHALLSLDGQPRLLLDFVHDHGVSLPTNNEPAPHSLARALGEGFDRLVMQDVSADRYDLLARGLSHQPLRPILWQVSQHGGDWDDLDGNLLRLARIRLLRWPDFRLLAHQHDGFRLCSLLLKRACSVDECQRLLGLDARTVQAFARSAYLCGYAMLEAPDASAAPTALNAAPGGSLLARMWRNLRGKHA